MQSVQTDEELMPYVSASRLSTYLRCGRLFYLRYIVQAIPEHHSPAFAFGRAWGTVIADYLMRATSGEAPPVAELAMLFQQELEREIADSRAPVLFDGEETVTTLVATATNMLGAFVDQVPLPEAVLGVEVAFSTDLVHPTTGRVLEPPLVGALDLVVRENGEPVVWELKTSKKRYSRIDLELSMLQPAAYTVGARALGYEKPDVVVLVTTKGKKPGVQIERLQRHLTDEIELVELGEQVLRAVRSGVFPRNRSWACTTCPHRAECGP